jgi:hypothetical protein
VNGLAYLAFCDFHFTFRNNIFLTEEHLNEGWTRLSLSKIDKALAVKTVREKKDCAETYF